MEVKRHIDYRTVVVILMNFKVNFIVQTALITYCILRKKVVLSQISFGFIKSVGRLTVHSVTAFTFFAMICNLSLIIVLPNCTHLE